MMSPTALSLWCWLALTQPAIAGATNVSAPAPGAASLAPPTGGSPAAGVAPGGNRRADGPWDPVPQFRLGLSYLRVVREDGDLTASGIQTEAAGLDLGFDAGYTRSHLGLSHQWESVAGRTARGFRLDLIAVGFPIPLLVNAPVRIHLEPILTVLRLQIMFATGAPTAFRFESGFGVMLTATFQRWFLGVAPFAVDFRYLSATEDDKKTGLTRVWPFQAVIGREF